jgi:hypothetical protein
MHVILENELQGINAAQAVIHEYVATQKRVLKYRSKSGEFARNCTGIRPAAMASRIRRIVWPSIIGGLSQVD